MASNYVLRLPLRAIQQPHNHQPLHLLKSFSSTACAQARSVPPRKPKPVQPDPEINDRHYRAIVVGAGPAGLATVGNLLDEDVKPILWVDDKFGGGRLNRMYREVPSNTTVALFIDFARATAALRKIVDAKPTPPAYAALEAMEQSTGCKIAAAADLCLTLTHGLGKDDGVIKKYGRVESVSLDEDGVWSVTTTPSASARRKGTTVTTTPLLVLATGSQPAQPRLIETYPHLSPLDLDVALSPTRLAAALPRREPMKIALVGASHSAILVLRNLYELASSTHPLLRIKWFSRHPLRYAVNKGDWILRDNTGLKGETRLWAKKNLEDGAWEKSDVKNYVEKIFTTPGEEEKAAYDKHLNSWDVDMVCEAIGFERSALPEFTRTTSGTGLDEGKANVTPMGKIEGDALTGALEEVGEDGEVRELKGLKGVGVAWPERVTDKEGNVESAVGLWKFMKYLKRVVPEWAKETRE